MNVSFPYPLSSKYSKTLELVYECVRVYVFACTTFICLMVF